MSRIYTAEHIRFLRRKIRGTSYAEITRLFNERFGLSATGAAVKALLERNGLVNGFGHGNPNIRKYTQRHIEFLKDHVAGLSNAELTELFNKKFGLSVTANSIQNAKLRYGLSSGIHIGFEKGHVPHNKGRKGYYAPGSEKGWFKPGNTPENYRPAGSERVNVGGYVEIKIADRKYKTARDRQKNWRAKHVVVWEEANGPVPKGHIVIFLDGDKSRIVLDNLMMISRKAHAVMCHMNWYTNDRKATKANCLMAEIKVAAASLKRKSIRSVKNRKMVFQNNNGYKVYVIRDKGGWVPVRETRAGNLIRLRVKKLEAKATRGEAQRDLREYAAYRGWMRI